MSETEAVKYQEIIIPLGEVQVGDEIPDGKGNWVTVSETYDEHMPEKMYEIETDNGETIQVSGNHLWYIETSLDHQMHYYRLKASKKLLKNMKKNVLEELLMFAEHSDDSQILEISLYDMVKNLGFINQPQGEEMLSRVAASLGHIAENNSQVEDLFSSTRTSIDTVKTYDAKLFAQQVLSLTGKRKYRKRWPVIVGQVVTTEEMIELQEHFEVNLP